jgi:hypothetical protein
MKSREPKFMKEIHKIRENLTKAWSKLSFKEILSSLHNSGQTLNSKLPHLIHK